MAQTVYRGISMRSIFCIVLSALGVGFYFFLNLFDSYLALSGARDSFYPNLLALLVFFAIVVGAAIRSLCVLLGRGVSHLDCSVVFVVCACLSFGFRSGLSSLADQVFFAANENYLKAKMPTKSGQETVAVVHLQSSLNFHKLIVHSSVVSVSDGSLSLDVIDALGSALSGLRGCDIDVKHLKDNFYVIRAYC